MKRVIIIGGGFAGVECARTLRHELTAAACEVVVFNRENHMVFHPLLAEVAGSAVNPDAVAAPLRQILRHVYCRTETVTELDAANRQVVFEGRDGLAGHLSYDHAVIACGRVVNLAAVPGMSDHAFPFKSIGDAMALRTQVIQRLESAEVCADPERRRWLMSFIVVGGGFSGVEVAGEINDLLRASLPFYPHIFPQEISVSLVHSGDSLLPEVGPELRQFATRKMEEARVKVILAARVAAATGVGVWLKDGSALHGATIVSTIGTAPTSLAVRIGGIGNKGVLTTEADLRLAGEERVWAIGDCARTLNAEGGGACPPTAQFAVRQGRHAARNILRFMKGEPTRPFGYKPLGQLCAIGRRNAVAEILGHRISGFPAWCLWRAVYLIKLPSWSRRIKAGGDWLWDLIFARDLLTLRHDPSERVSHAFFRRGDYVFRQGDPATDFYLIERGEVEVLRTNPGGGRDVIAAILGPGDYFGELALLERRTHNAHIRARTDVEVTTMGAEVFTRLSKSLSPLKQRLGESMRRRSVNLPERLPDVHRLLQTTALSRFVEPSPPSVHVDQPFHEALRRFAVDRVDVLFVVEDHGILVGVMTRTDLLRAIDAAVTATPDQRHRFSVRQFMTPDVKAVFLQDSAAAAGALLWGRGLKVLPVLLSAECHQLAGCVRAETLMHEVIEQLRGKGIDDGPTMHEVVMNARGTSEQHSVA